VRTVAASRRRGVAAILRPAARLVRDQLSAPWRDREHVELETLNYVDWFNNDRPHESIDDVTPRQAEEVHYAARNRLRPTG